MTTFLGVDVGGTGIKAALVDVDDGSSLSSRRREIATPKPATPGEVVSVIAQLVADFDMTNAIGVGFPGVVRGGVVATAPHLDPSWIGMDAPALIARRSGVGSVTVLNDADAAGIAEVRFGAGAGLHGVVVMVTLGTGIGTAVFHDGTLIPNAEYGHLVIGNFEAEHFASGRAMLSEGMSWATWAQHLDAFLVTVENLIWPDLFIIGGGISSEFQRFRGELGARTPIRAAALGNDAGIIGAALAARDAA